MKRAALLLLMLFPALAQGAAPAERALYEDGPDGRYLLEDGWEVSEKRTTGFKPVSVPSSFNAAKLDARSMRAGVRWYRTTFDLPAGEAAGWNLRFESVNREAEVFLNGRKLGEHQGAYIPFELSGGFIQPTGNQLLVKVDARLSKSDLPPGNRPRGWWNYGGILREVYLRKVDGVDFADVQVRPDLPCRTCSATVDVRFKLRNPGRGATRTRVTGSFGGKRLSFGTVTVGPKSSATLVRKVKVARPKLWSPERPALYSVKMEARSAGSGRSRRLQAYQLKTGIRSVKVVNGQWLLNGKPMNFRGVGLHEDDPKLGFAITNRIREREVDETKELGGTVMRSHYPLHPYTHELADEKGMMIWSEVPVYALKTPALASLTVRKLAAKELETNIRTNQNHPSVIVWSIGNELSARPGPVQGFYIARAARSAKKLDPTRPVGYAVAGYRDAGCQPEYGPLDVIGVNEYFGWYPGPNGQIADRELLSEYLDSVHACYPKKAVLVSEFGAEANRSGPVEEKGTFEFQSDFVNYHLGVYATKPWLTGAIYWALEEFRVRPGWNGGNPYPNSPIHEKGLITFNGVRKPAFAEVQRIFKATDQFGTR